MLVRKSDSRKRRDGTRSSAKRACSGCSTGAKATQAVAVISTASRHPEGGGRHRRSEKPTD